MSFSFLTHFPPGIYLVDTSCLIRFVNDELGDATTRVRDLLRNERPNIEVVTLNACVFEALGVLESQRFLREPAESDIDARPSSSTTVQFLVALQKAPTMTVLRVIPVLPDISNLREVSDASEGLDVADGLLLRTAEMWNREPTSGDPATRPHAILVTADGPLGRIASKRGVRVWNPSKNAAPLEP